MKKFISLIVIIFLILLIASTKHNSTSQTIENLAYVIAIGIDNGDSNLLKLTFQIATPASGSSDSSGSSGSSNQSSESTTTTTVECSSINSGINIVNSYISKKINVSHCKIIVFSESFASNSLSDEISTLANNPEIRPDCSIVISKCDAKDFININKPILVTLTARFYEIVLSSGDYTGFSKNVTLLEFYNSLKDDYSETTAVLAGINLPSTHSISNNTNYIDIDNSYTAGRSNITNNNNMQISGLAVFRNGVYVGELTSMDSICHLILKNQLQTALISIPDPFDSAGLINLSLLQYKSPDISVKLINGSPYIDCKVYLKATIVSLSSNSDFSTKNNLETISNYANSYMKSHINDYLYKTSKEYNSDIVGFGRNLLKNYPTVNDWKNINWKSNYKNSFFNVDVDTKIITSNLILKN